MVESDMPQISGGVRRLAAALERAGGTAPQLLAAVPITVPWLRVSFALAGPLPVLLVQKLVLGDIGWPAAAALTLWCVGGGHLGSRLFAMAQRHRLRSALGFDLAAEMWLGADADRLTFWRRTALGRTLPEPLGSIAVAEWRSVTTRWSIELTATDGRRFRLAWQREFNDDLGHIRWLLGERPDDVDEA